MSIAVKDHYHLAVLTAQLVGDETVPRSATDQLLGLRLEAGGDLLAAVSIAIDEVQLPPDLGTVVAQHGVKRVRLPEYALRQISESLQRCRPGEPLWLALGTPAGHLATIPWEHLLQPALGVPVLRLPSAAFEPVGSAPPLQIAVCAPAADPSSIYDVCEHLQRFVAQIGTIGAGPSRIHVFTNSERARQELQPGSGDGLVVHVPYAALAEPPPPAQLPSELPLGVPGRVDNPWLRWMLETLERTCVDVVHFISSGYLSADYGALDLGVTPLGESSEITSRLVDAAQLSAFLTRIGAWAAGFTIASRTRWPAGTRMVAQSVAESRPGFVLVDSPHHASSQADDLGAAYAVMVAPDPSPPPASPACSIYVHPMRVQRPDHPLPLESGFEAQIEQRLQALTLKGSPAENLLRADEPVPEWLATNQRTLERYVADLTEPHIASEHRDAVDLGVQTALEFVSDVLAKHLPSDSAADEGPR